MAADHRFYKRFNFESVPMEEYEVRDVARRNEVPDLKLELQWASDSRSQVVDLLASVSNESPEPAGHVVIRLYVDARIEILDQAEMSGPIDHKLTSERGEIAVRLLSMNWSTHMKMPIWEGEKFFLTNTPIRLVVPLELGNYVAGWRLTGPRMKPKEQYYTLIRYGSDIRVVEHI
jgi:hypothetical protein